MQLKIAFTGKIDLTRNEMKAKLKELGHKPVSFGPKAELLIAGDKNAKQWKIDLAKSKNIPVICTTDIGIILAFVKAVAKNKKWLTKEKIKVLAKEYWSWLLSCNICNIIYNIFKQNLIDI